MIEISSNSLSFILGILCSFVFLLGLIWNDTETDREFDEFLESKEKYHKKI